MLIRSGSVLLKNGVSFVLGVMQYMHGLHYYPTLPLHPKTMKSDADNERATLRYRVYQTVGSSASGQQLRLKNHGEHTFAK